MPCYPRLSQATDGLSAQVYTSLLAIAQASGREVYALNVGDTYLEPPECASVTALAKLRTKGLHRYAEVRGEPALLDAIVGDLERRTRPVPRESIQVTAGGTSGLDLACRTLLSSGDEVLVLAPYWPLIRGIVSAAGARPVEVPLYTELRRPGFDLERTLERARTPKTTAIYVNSPNNPTGVVLNEIELDVLARFVRKHDLWLLSDEAYERLSYVAAALPSESTRSDAAPAPIWLHPAVRERAIVLHTLSKSYGLAGARVAYLHGPPEVMAALSGLQTFATYCAARPMQVAAAGALSSDEGEAWLSRARSAYRAAAEATARALRISVPDSGTFAFFDLTPLLQSGESPSELLERVARSGVVLTPGAVAGSAYATWARLCFTAVEPTALARALATLESLLYP
jgi:N-succinyldiaminopimelate aminotransferase